MGRHEDRRHYGQRRQGGYVRQGEGVRQAHAQGLHLDARGARPEGGARHLQDLLARLRALLPELLRRRRPEEDRGRTRFRHGRGLHRHAEERHHLHRQGRQQDRRRQRVQGVRRLQARRHERHRERRLREDGQGLQRQGWQVDVHDLVLLRRVDVQDTQGPREGQGRAEEGGGKASRKES